MALAKSSGGGMSGWLAAALLALGVFAAVGNTSDQAGAGQESTAPGAAVTVED